MYFYLCIFLYIIYNKNTLIKKIVISFKPTACMYKSRLGDFSSVHVELCNTNREKTIF